MTSSEGLAAGAAVRGTLVVAVGTTVANVLGYLLTLIAARALGPVDFGAFAALLGLLVIGNVAALGLQTTTARHVAATDGAQSMARVARTTVVAVVVVGVLLAWPMQRFLALDSLLGPLLIAAALGPLTWIGFCMGLAQGAQAYGRLATLVAITALGRTVAGAAGVLVGDEVAGAAGMALGLLLAAVVGASITRSARGGEQVGQRSGLVEVGHATHTLLAFFVLANMDILLARAELSEVDAGLYAVGAILAKIAFWLPQAIGMVAFPHLVAEQSRSAALRLATVALTAVGAALTLGTAVLGRLAVQVVGGEDYLAIASTVWLWAALGSLLSVLNLLVLARLARGDRTVVWLLWTGVAAAGATVMLGPVSTPAALAASMCVVVALVAAVLLVTLGRDRYSASSSAGHGPGV